MGRGEGRGKHTNLEVLFVAVYIGGPAVVIAVEPALLGRPSPIRVGGRGTDLHVGDPARLHPQWHVALEVWSGNTHTHARISLQSLHCTPKWKAALNYPPQLTPSEAVCLER